MATTVNAAFKEFMKDIVNLDPDVVSAARISRDNLLLNLMKKTDSLICTKDLMSTLVPLHGKQNAGNSMILT